MPRVDYDTTYTRSELHAARNGHTPDVVPEEVADDPEPRACRNCGTPLEGRQAHWCSNRCKKQAGRSSGDEPRRARSRARDPDPPPAVEPHEDEVVARVAQALADDVVEVVALEVDAPALLTAAGFEVTGYLLDLAGERWTLTKTQ